MVQNLQKNTFDTPRWLLNAKAGGIAAFIDAEHALTDTTPNLGVNIDDLIISQPDHGEQAPEIADNLIRSGAIDMS